MSFGPFSNGPLYCSEMKTGSVYLQVVNIISFGVIFSCGRIPTSMVDGGSLATKDVYEILLHIIWPFASAVRDEFVYQQDNACVYHLAVYFRMK